MNRTNNPRLDNLIRHYPADSSGRHTIFLHWVCLPALIFAMLGILFTINFGLVLITIALAILYYCRFGQRIAAEMAAALLVMLAIWMVLMPSHHLVACSLGIFILALAGQFAARSRIDRAGLSFVRVRRHLLGGPVFGLVLLRERLLRDKPAKTEIQI